MTDPLVRAMRAFIVDMDGVLWEGEQPLPGLLEFFATLRNLNARFILATNNASQTPEQYVDKLARMGVQVTRDEILTSAQATALYLRAKLVRLARLRRRNDWVSRYWPIRRERCCRE